MPSAQPQLDCPSPSLGGLGLMAAKRISMDQAERPRLKQAIQWTLAIQAIGCLSIIFALVVRRFI